MPAVEGTRVSRNPYRTLCVVLALLIPAALLGFGASYFRGLTFSGLTVTPLLHVHAAVMALWLLLLIAQAWFVRTMRFRLHRWVGRSSFVIVPLIIVLAIVATHESLTRRMPGISAEDVRLEVYSWGQLLGFGLSWGLGILYRKRTPFHVRFMISTVFAIGSAIVFRIIVNWFQWIPGLDSLDNQAAANGAVLTLILLALIAMDWRLGIRRSPFWVVTAAIAITHLGYFTFARTDGWAAFVQWFADLPSW